MQKEQLEFIAIERIPERGRIKPRQSAAACSARARSRRRSRNRKRIDMAVFWASLIFLSVLGIRQVVSHFGNEPGGGTQNQRTENQEVEKQMEILEAGGESYPHQLSEMLEKNEETLNFVEGYGEREKWLGQEIDLRGEVTSGQVPLLLQWDRRWGYNAYGDDMIGWAGCGPVCMTMAYIYLTDDATMNPRKMAEFADQNGYNSEQGTSWDFWTSGAAALGLRGTEMSLDEDAMREALDNGGLVVCSMRPGDFTTVGHFILIRGYDENGFFVNDPNRRSNSEKQWSFDTLQGQIKNLWGIYR